MGLFADPCPGNFQHYSKCVDRRYECRESCQVRRSISFSFLCFVSLSFASYIEAQRVCLPRRVYRRCRTRRTTTTTTAARRPTTSTAKKAASAILATSTTNTARNATRAALVRTIVSLLFLSCLGKGEERNNWHLLSYFVPFCLQSDPSPVPVRPLGESGSRRS